MDTITEEKFRIWVFYLNETYQEVVIDNPSAENAVLKVKELIQRPVTEYGPIERITITDSDDMTCFEWRRVEGIVFPPPPAQQS